MIYFTALLGIIWILGWIASYFETSVCQETNVLKKILQMILLFFIWPFVAFSMVNQKH